MQRSENNHRTLIDVNNIDEIDNEESIQDDDPYQLSIIEPDISEIIYSGLVLIRDYILLKQIGHGNNAVVWMAYRFSTKSYCAIKIQNYQCYEDGRREVSIIDSITKYAQNTSGDINCVSMIDYFVIEESNILKFVCSVYHLYAGSLQMLYASGKYTYGLPLPIVKRITRQILHGLSVLHDKLNIVHTDIKPENILLAGITKAQQDIMDLFTKSGFIEKYNILYEKIGDDQDAFYSALDIIAADSVNEIINYQIDDFSKEQLEPDAEESSDEEYQRNSDDDDEEDIDDDDDDEYDNGDIIINRRDQSVDDTLESLDYSDIHDLEAEMQDTDGNSCYYYDFDNMLNRDSEMNPDEKISIIDDNFVINCQCAITDFGNSYLFSKRTIDEIQDRNYRSPEVILDLNYGYGVDIFSLGCVIFELATGFLLFMPLAEPLNPDIHHLYLMEKSLGPIPLKMKKKSPRKRFLFDKERDYHIKNIAPFNQIPLHKRLENQFNFTKSDANEFAQFLMECLAFDPANRPTAKALLKHAWLAE
jgi:serine/threonine-protein kinase SRPK3